jgi:YidC/Oxa1 family membrane protein insertase
MEKKDLSMEIRLLIAFALAGLILFAQAYFFPSAPAQPSATKTPAASTSTAIPIPAAGAAANGQAPPAEVPGQIEAGQETVFAVETKLYHVEFSNRGAVVKRWLLKAYKEHAEDAAKAKQVDLVNSLALTRVPAPFSVAFKGQAPGTDVNTALYRFQQPDPLTVNFEFSDGRIDVKKSFSFQDDSYLVAVSSQATQNGAPLVHALSWRGGFGDSTASTALTNQHALYYDTANSKLTIKTVKDAKDGPVSSAGQYSFAGLEDSYFAGVFMPEGRALVELTEYSDSIPDANLKSDPRVGAAVGGEASNTFTFFAGPKDYKLLGKINPKLEQLIDWSWLGISLAFITKPIFLVLSWTADHITNNYGWAIVLVTLGINTVLFPLRLTSLKSSKKMQAIQPLIKELNERYKGLPLKDPRQADNNTEMMDL